MTCFGRVCSVGSELHAEIDATSPKYLRDKYAIVGVGETPYMRGSGITTRALATWAVRNAIADAGLRPADVDGMLSYHFVLGDFDLCAVDRRRPRHPAQFPHGCSGRRRIDGGPGRHRHGSYRGRHVQVVVIYRAVNGFSQVRAGGSGARAMAPVANDMLHTRAYGMHSAGNQFAFTFMRHMYDYGTRPGAGRRGARDPQRARVQQPEGALQKTGHASTDVLEQPDDLHAAASARLLRGNRQRHRDRRHQRGARARLPAHPGADPQCRRPLQQAPPRHALPAWTDFDHRRRFTRTSFCGPTRVSRPRRSMSPAHMTPSPSRRCCSSKTMASARRARAAPT